MKIHTSFSKIKEDLISGETSCKKLVANYLDNIRENEHLNIYLEVYGEESQAKAEEVDAKLKAGIAGKLAGMVVGIKDVLCYTDHGLQGGSKILDGFESQFTGTAIQRLIDEDAIIIGRQNCDEFAMGSSNEN
ncbi:MAG: amidase family protein, partial [Cyclobacteriaceae bacterium]|nr:amidase family protein [Cyclobacteriaceae bacterium]